MKALTICQPFAELILSGEKRIENRTWFTPHRGPLLIHAGKNRDWLEKYADAVRTGCLPEPQTPLPDDMPFGSIVGQVQLVACIKLEQIGVQREVFDKRYNCFRRDTRWSGLGWMLKDPHASGPWCWLLDKPVRFDPVFYRGAHGLFDVPENVIEGLKTR
jgi:activating signal cointegrator 1